MLTLDLPLLFAISTRRARAYSGQISKIPKRKGRKNKKSFFVLSTYFPHVPDAGTFPFVTLIRMEVSQVHSTNFQTLFFREKKKKERKKKERNSLIFRATITHLP